MAATRQAVRTLIEGTKTSRTPSVLGSKGAGLAGMVDLGLPVPPAFILTTSVHRAYTEHGTLPKRVPAQLERSIATLEKQTGQTFGDPSTPLLVSVRSGGEYSMPGMMDTLLNVGINRHVVMGIATSAGNAFALDTYCRFLRQWASLVVGIDRADLTALVVTQTSGLAAGCDTLEEAFEAATSSPVPTDPKVQLLGAIQAVFESWDSERAVAYRGNQNLPSWKGTAVTVQAMVFGNLDSCSGTGVVFSRDVTTGARGLFGEYLPQAQGEDVVSGIRTPFPVSWLETAMPSVYAQLEQHVNALHDHLGDIVDVEFTVEQGTLFILQYRRATRTALAAATFAVHQVWDRKWTHIEAVSALTPDQIAQCTTGSLTPEVQDEAIARGHHYAKGIPASGGAVTGCVAFTSDQAQAMAGEGKDVILMRADTSPDDLPGMLVSKAIVTVNGGVTCHAAVVARQLGIPAVVGCELVDDSLRPGLMLGEMVTVDGSSGNVYRGILPLSSVAPTKEVNLFLRWIQTSQETAACLKFELMKQRFSANQFLFDFYLTEAMATAAGGSRLAGEALELRNATRDHIASAFAMYLAIAICGEVRYYEASQATPQADIAWGQIEDLVSESSDRATAQLESVSALRTMGIGAQCEFAQAVAEVFKFGNWGSAGRWSTGGPRWQAIAEALHGYLSGNLAAALFIDHVFDLRHNGGRLFDKHPMFSVNTTERALQAQLSLKKEARTLSELHSILTSRSKMTTFSPPVATLWDKGTKLGSW